MKLLFLCTHNRCRSILAEAITNHMAGDQITAVSAGSTPQGHVHPLSLQYLQERQINTDGLKSQSWHDFKEFNPDAIVTLCDSAAQETCPLWFDAAIQVHWGLSDPSSETLNETQQRTSFNATIDILERRVKRLLDANKASLTSANLRAELIQIAEQIH